MPEDPEDVLPEYGVTATCDIEEIRSQYTVKRQKYKPYRDGRKRKKDNGRCNKCCPCKHWHPHVGHAWSTHSNNRCEKVNAPDERSQTRDLKADGVEIHTMRSTVFTARKRRI
ncbi:hypothetical protein D3C76_1541130 [compost metagenome]